MAASAVSVTGERKEWHKITLDFKGPFRTETPETFRDFRLDVTFTNKQTGDVITVPGFFAADGDAAETGATSGDIWRVNFNPPSEGDWTYTASFRTGDDIAASTSPNAGTPVASINGATGTFKVTETDKAGDDFRAKGMILQAEGTHYLQHQGDGDFFVRGGPGIPENFLANKDIDNTPTGRHDFNSHAKDAKASDPTWDGGKGKNILGAVNYLANQDQNTIYVLTNSAGGDGRDVWPWAANDLNKINKNDKGIANNERDVFSTYDVSKLAQWEIIFDHMDEQGIYKNILFQETENDQLLDGGTNVAGSSLSAERMIYMREMIARFGHNNGIQWNLGEENTNSTQQLKDMASFVKDVDGYDHAVVVHTFGGDWDDVYDPLIGYEDFDGISGQIGANSIRDRLENYGEESTKAGDPWILAWDEDSGGNAIINVGSNNPDSANEKSQREAFWATLTVGGSGGNWYFKNASGHSLDQNYDDFRGHSSVWKWTAAATSFFNTYIPFWEMTESDNVTRNTGDYVLAKDGEYYVVYLPYGEASDVRLDLSKHGGETFDVFWYNPREGGDLIRDGQVTGGGVKQLGGAPTQSSKDWVLFVRNVDAPDNPLLTEPAAGLGDGSAPKPVEDPVGEAPPQSAPEGQTGDGYFAGVKNGGGYRFKVQMEDPNGENAGKNPGGAWSFENKADSAGHQAGFQGDGYYLFGNANSSSNNGSVPENSILEYQIYIPEGQGGVYTFRVAASRDPGSEGDKRNDLWVKINEDARNYMVSDKDPVKSKGFVKVFGAATSDWGFSTKIDAHSTKPTAEFELDPGFHTISLGGRSQGYYADYFELYKGPTPGKNAPDSQFIVGETPPPTTQPPQDEPPADPPPANDPPNVQPPANDPPSPPSNADVTAKLYVYDSKTDKVIAGPLKAGEAVDIGSNPNRAINIVVEFEGDDAAAVDSARLKLNGNEVTQVENAVPFALFGDMAGDLRGEALSTGEQTLQVEAFTGGGATGSKLETFSFDFSIEADGAAPPSNAPPPPAEDPDPVIDLDVDIDPPAGYDLTMVLALVDADQDEVITRIAPGGEIDGSMLNGASLNLKANVFGAGMEDVKSVNLIIDGEERLEIMRPYAVFGDEAGDYLAAGLTAGAHSVTVQAFTNAQGVGQPLMQRTFDFTALDAMGNAGASPTLADVADESIADQPMVVSLALVDADTDTVLQRIHSGSTLEPSQLAGADLALKANVYGHGMENIGSVRITVDDEFERVEIARPFAVFGDEAGNYLAGALTSGAHSVTVEAFASEDATGVPIAAQTFDFTAAGDIGDPTLVQEPDDLVGVGGGELLEMFLVDMETGKSLGEIRAGAEIAIDGGLAARDLRVEARVNDAAADAGQVESIALSVNDAAGVKNEPDYDFFAERKVGLGGAALEAGSYEISAAAYSGDGATGAKIDEEKLTFTVTEDGLVA